MRRAEHAADAKLQRRRGGRLKTESVPGVVFAPSVAASLGRCPRRPSRRSTRKGRDARSTCRTSTTTKTTKTPTRWLTAPPNGLVDRVSGRDGIDVIYGNDNYGDFAAARDPVS
jgi:hypothetical protein